MGLSIHYQGSFKDASKLTSMIDEVTTIAKTNQWDYFVFETEFPNATFTKTPEKENLYGMCISPPNCESVNFSFLSNGKMCAVEKLQKYSPYYRGLFADNVEMIVKHIKGFNECKIVHINRHHNKLADEMTHF